MSPRPQGTPGVESRVRAQSPSSWPHGPVCESPRHQSSIHAAQEPGLFTSPHTTTWGSGGAPTLRSLPAGLSSSPPCGLSSRLAGEGPGSSSRLRSRSGARTTRCWGEEGGVGARQAFPTVGGTLPQPHSMVSTGPRGQLASPGPGPWLSPGQMSYKRAEGTAARPGGGRNNGIETAGQWGPRATGATVVCHTMGRGGTAAGANCRC